MAGRKRPRGDSPPQSDPSSDYRTRPRTGERAPGVWQGGGPDSDSVTFVSGEDNPFVKAMRELYLRPIQQWTQTQRAQPTRYPETWFLTDEAVGDRRRQRRGHGESTYNPPSEARRQAGPLRSFSEGQRTPGNEGRLREAVINRPADLPPLTQSAMRDAALRALFELSQSWDSKQVRSGSTGYITPTLYEHGPNSLPRTRYR